MKIAFKPAFPARWRSVGRPAAVVGVLGVVLICLFADEPFTPCGGAAEPARGGAAKAADPSQSALLRAALGLAVTKNLGYCRDWLDSKDWKSLAQTADGAAILARVLAQQGAGAAWRKGTAELAANLQSLRAAADGESADKAKTLLEQAAVQVKAIEKLSPDKADRSDKLTVPLKPLMLLLDATHADAKGAVAAGDVDEAKSMARVLSTLGQVVSNQRDDGRWRKSAADLIEAADAISAAEKADAKTVRQQLRGVYERCEACHRSTRG